MRWRWILDLARSETVIVVSMASYSASDPSFHLLNKIVFLWPWIVFVIILFGIGFCLSNATYQTPAEIPFRKSLKIDGQARADLIISLTLLHSTVDLSVMQNQHELQGFSLTVYIPFVVRELYSGEGAYVCCRQLIGTWGGGGGRRLSDSMRVLSLYSPIKRTSVALKDRFYGFHYHI
jgi:hypothetical protein